MVIIILFKRANRFIGDEKATQVPVGDFGPKSDTVGWSQDRHRISRAKRPIPYAAKPWAGMPARIEPIND